MLLDDLIPDARRDSIARLGVLQRSADPGLTGLTRLAAYVSGARGAAIHILDGRLQHRVAATGAPLGTHPQPDTMCRLVLDDERRIVCADASRDPRFGYSSFVRGDQPVRFYASLPLRSRDGLVLGTLCAFDTVTRTLDDEQLARLEDIADEAASRLELMTVAVDLGHAACHDPLTGAVNRLMLSDRLAQAFARRARHGGRTFLALLDIDDFKQINDDHGHEAGDQVLIEIAHRLMSIVRGQDTVARIGGDEFVVLAELAEGAGSDSGVAGRLQGTLSAPMQVAGERRHVGVSVGCVAADPGERMSALLERADAAMYARKRAAKVPAAP